MKHPKRRDSEGKVLEPRANKAPLKDARKGRPSKVRTFFRDKFKQDADRMIEETAVLELVRRAVLSQGKAAELLGLSRWQLADLMARYDVPSFELLLDESMEQHVTSGREVMRQISPGSA